MNDIAQAFTTALRLILHGDPVLLEIVALSLRVSGTALAFSLALGLPLGATLASARFPGRRGLIALLNSCMGLPPVVAGLVVYLLLGRGGPLGALEWLFTPRAMVLAQTILVTPIVAALTRQVIEDLREEYDEQLRAFGLRGFRAAPTLLYEGRFTLATVVLAAFGRAIAEVGAVIVVGGNIAHHTRVMTTAVALETSRGDFALALGLGILLLAFSLATSGGVEALREVTRRAGA